MKKIIVLIILLWSTPLFAYEFAEKWDTKDTILQGVFIAESLVDLGQTLDIAKRPNEYYEKLNFLLPKHPTTGQVVVVMSGLMVVHTLISMALPPKYEVFGFDVHHRLLWQSISIVSEGGNILNNAQLGLTINF